MKLFFTLLLLTSLFLIVNGLPSDADEKTCDSVAAIEEWKPTDFTKSGVCPDMDDVHWYEVAGTATVWACGTTGSNKLRIYRPLNDSKQYGIVLFMRGSGGWDSGYTNWLCSMARKSLIVLAPTPDTNTRKSPECKKNKDLLTAYKWAVNNHDKTFPTAKPIVSDGEKLNVKIGVGGHSAGAHHIPSLIESAKNQKLFDVSAVLFSHGGKEVVSKDSIGNIPSMFTTSKDDGTVDPGDVLNYYNKATESNPKLFVSLNYGDHNEPHYKNKDDSTSHGYQLNTHMSQFFACHLNGDGINGDDCEKIANTCNSAVNHHYGDYNDCKYPK
jgi:hypothetical protein